MKDTYLTLAGTSEGLYKEKGSKFLAYAYPIKKEEDVKEIVDALKKQYYDARHHCFAWVLGKEGERYRANDDGEPNHSAGDPILGQIRSNNLTNVLIVVVRYFGGTKLGVPGLVNAYRTSAAEAIEEGEIVEKILTIEIPFRFEYLSMNDVMKLIKEYDLEIVKQEFDNVCEMEISVREKLFEQVYAKLKDIDGLYLLEEEE
ncbi:MULTISPECIES: YigZ family protein [Persicobacter]|uniref:Impact N-terminal domain-containing protein n=1 Tax=Persicobacter diffluens TaxID=981 RepID=A0AAN4VUW1_9BACT|nr:YigZ family protein [Persicobacter sp. CCB-QB2]GJM59827.1 hypothetical protein PEDI_03790 [Persicobacter diffluens]